jgi:iron complex outermembrane receptor protein
MPIFRRAPWRALALCAAALPCLAHAAGAADDANTPVSGVVVNGQAAADRPLSAVRVTAADIAETINATTAEDALKYLPNIFIRRRHIGDTQAPMTTRTSGVGASARSLVYADGVLLSALIGNNNSTASPRWGMVAPEEIATVGVLYGPFSAAYAGNSIGAVVNITTRTPDRFTATAKLTGATQAFGHYSTDRDFGTYEASVGVGDRMGPLAWRLSYNRVGGSGQPLTYATAIRPGATSATGTPAVGAVTDLNRLGQPIVVLGEGGLERQTQDKARMKLVWEATPRLTLSYLVGYFGAGARAHANSYLRDAAGQTVWSGALNIGGYAYSVPASAFSAGTYRLDEDHWMQAASLGFQASDAWRITAIATAYDYAADEQRTPTAALPAAARGGAGSITDMSGTGWTTFDLTADGRPHADHHLKLGAHLGRDVLANDRYATPDWLSGPRGALAAAAHGETETSALWAEDVVRLPGRLDLTLGARWEHWRAHDGINYSLSPAQLARQPALSADRVSPKAGLTWRMDAGWTLSARAGLAWRFPTVGELYQAVTTGTTISIPDPHLRPERAVSTELSAGRAFARANLRLSAFTEDIDDALISQTGQLPGGFATFVQNVGKVRARGAELVGEARDVGLSGFDLSGSVTYADARTARDAALPAAAGRRLPQVPRWRATLVGTWRPNDQLTLTAAARYSDRVYATIDNSDPVTHTYQGFDGYLVLDARAAWRIDDHWSAAIGVDNLGGRDYFLFHPFPQRTVLAELKYVY